MGNAIQIDTLSIVPGSVQLIGYDTSEYHVNYGASILYLNKIPVADSLLISYRVFYENLGSPFFHKNKSWVDSSFVVQSYYYNAVQANTKTPFVDFGNMDYNGSFGRMLSFGNSQDIVLNSQFNLQMQGELGDSIFITGAITDNTIPFQPEGNTQQLQEFDKVFIQLQKRKASLIAGDYDIKKPEGYFMNFYKRVQGVFLSNSFTTSKHGENKIALAASLAKGKFVRNILTAIEGNQGPYKLTGPNGEQYFVVLAGTERVYIDGIIQKRGEDYDYVIDYNTAEIIFMPRRIITKDLRLSVEFEFSDRNYINSLLYLNNEWKINHKVQLRLNVYSNQDAKNQSVQQTLDANQKIFLKQIGDSIQNAYYPSVKYEDTFSNNRILYRKTDTSVNAIVYANVYIFSVDKDSAKYSLSFSYVGEGKGNYIQSINSSNGRVYAWVAPLNGIPTGNYEPVVVLVTPKKLQMISLGSTMQLDSNKVLQLETALSNSDPNTFSLKDNDQHIGLAARLHYQEERLLNKKQQIKLQSTISYEFVQDRFKPLERFRQVEFNRDWNVPLASISQNEHLGFIHLALVKNNLGRVSYQFGTYLRGAMFTGTQHVALIEVRKKTYFAQAKADYMQQNTNTYSGNFFRPTLHIEKRFEKLNSILVGTKFFAENNALRDAISDTLTKSAFSFDVLNVYVKTKEAAKNPTMLEYIHRNDQFAKNNNFVQATDGHTFSLQSKIESIKNQTLQLTATHRILLINDSTLTPLKPEHNSLGRLEYNFSLISGLITGNSLYEFGLGQEQKREFAYVEVPAGQGIYVWRDYNLDSLKQLNEFELAIFPDEKLYIKIFTPTNQYVKAKYSLYNQNISINPSAIIRHPKKKSFALLISKFFLQSAIQLNNRFLSEAGFAQYNPFIKSFSDSTLISNASSLVNSIFFNRFSNVWGIDYIRSTGKNKTLLNYGVDSRRNTENLVRGRYNLNRKITVALLYKSGSKSALSPFLENRNYTLQLQSIEPSITFLLLKNQLRILTAYKYDERNNAAMYGGEMAIANNLNLDIKYNIISSGVAGLKFTYSTIQYNGLENTGLSYTMLDGLQKGSNLLWQANFSKRVSKNIEMNLEYEGRKSASNAVIHTGRASVRAIF
ncbi:MAG: hypothetical protein IPI46_07055 [Bacteroidetes bacterium]|nr:hypothetical protein [Bacteroidota bacterium]